jgi:hypothetical protein
MQLDFAMLLTAMLPNEAVHGIKIGHLTAPTFVDWLETFKVHQSSRGAGVGLLLSIIAITEFMFVRKLGTEEDWAAKLDGQLSMRENARQAQNEIALSFVEKKLAVLPDRADAWLGTIRSWMTLRASRLSDEVLLGYLRPSP